MDVFKTLILDTPDSLSSITGTLQIVNGGTGATTAAGARTNLGLGTAAVLDAGSANGAATLGSDSKLTSSQIPDISVVEYLGSVASQSAMLALTGQKGDWCTRSDLGTNFIITGSTPSSLSSWTQLSYPTAPVTSVAGKTGAVTISPSDITGLGTNVATFLATPTSANLAAALTDETGTGSSVFANSPTLVTPVLGAATATSINSVAITAPASGSTLTIANGKTLTASNTLTLAGTDSTTMTFPSTSASIARTDAAQTFTGTQTVTAIAGLSTLTGNAGNMTITSGTGNSRTMALQTTDGTGVSQTVVTLDSTKLTTLAGSVDVATDIFVRGANASRGGQITVNNAAGGLYFTGLGTSTAQRFYVTDSGAAAVLALRLNTGTSSTGSVESVFTTEATTAGAGSLTTAGGIYAAKAIISGSTTASTSTTTGSGVFGGGIGVAGKIYGGDELHLTKSANADFPVFINNASTGTAGQATLYVANVNDTGASAVGLGVNSTGLTTAGGFIANAGYLASGTSLSNGLSIMARSGDVRIYAGGHTTLAATFSGANTSLSGNLTLGAGATITGGAGNMTITAGTGNSRTLLLQTTTSVGVATTALTLNADQSATFASTTEATTAGAGSLTTSGGIYATKKIISGSTTASTSTTTGSIITAGGLGVAGAIYGGDTINDSKGEIRLIPQNSQSTAYTAVLADAGKHLLHPSADTTARTFTIPANSSVAYSIGTAITFVNQNGAGTMTIAITTDTMRLAGAGTTGSRTLAANGIATALKITSTEWIISGTGLT